MARAIYGLRTFAIVFFLCLMPSVAFSDDLIVDGTSVESYERSVRQMADSLDEDDREIFARGLLNMIVTEYPAAQGASGLQLLQFMEPAIEAAHVTLDGRSRDEILERGRSVAAEKSGRTNSGNSDSVGDRDIEALRQCIQDRVVIESANITKREYSGHAFEITVTNGLEWPISAIRGSYRAFSEGRSVAWMDETFAIAIPGGIEPGETRSVGIYATVPADAPDDLIVQVVMLDVADQFQRLLIGDVQVINWSDERSDLDCLKRGRVSRSE